jgi:two-component system LytT family sensor kinase
MEKQENELMMLKKEKEVSKLHNRVQVIAAAVVILVLLLVLFMIYKYYRFYKGQLIRKEERQRRLELESQLKLFQARINPHFLFNSLNSIKEAGHEKDPQKLDKMVQALSDIYRRILYSHDTLMVPLKNEIAIIRDYLEIEKRRFAGQLDYSIAVDQELMEYQVLPLTMETLVENSVMHGLSPQKGGTLQLNVYKNGKRVFIEIIDDGVGFAVENMEPGFGIFSVQERLKLYYRNKAVFHIHSQPGKGTRVKIELPWVPHE